MTCVLCVCVGGGGGRGGGVGEKEARDTCSESGAISLMPGYMCIVCVCGGGGRVVWERKKLEIHVLNLEPMQILSKVI